MKRWLKRNAITDVMGDMIEEEIEKTIDERDEAKERRTE